MCTALTFQGKSHYFGRNFDYDMTYNEKVIITPRNYTLSYKKSPNNNSHYAIIGGGTIIDNYPLYYDGVNEHGLCMAALNFPKTAAYNTPCLSKENIAPYELIPRILSTCSNIKEAKEALFNISVTDIPFSSSLPVSPLHWIISDEKSAITAEPTKNGLKIYDNIVGVLTNEPEFPYHMQNLNNYMHLSNETPVNNFSLKLPLVAYSLGMGGIGLPGDLSSASRFIKAVFTKFNSVCQNSTVSSVNQFFHILSSVEQQKGCTKTGADKYEITLYSSCCDTKEGIYYYKTYENSTVNAVSLHKENLNSTELIYYPFLKQDEFLFQN